MQPYISCDTESQVERTVERETNRLDSKLMAGRLTQEEYDTEMRDLDKWADKQYAKFAEL